MKEITYPRILIGIPLCIIGLNSNVFSQDEITPTKICNTPTYSEAPVIDQQGNIYVSEPYRGPITKISPEGDTSIWAELKGANGHRILKDGTHLVCDWIAKAVLKLDLDGKVLKVAASTCGDYPLRHPNDLTLDENGGFYFTDPWDRENGDLIGRVCYVDAEGESHVVTEYEGMPNGIAHRPGDSNLYVAMNPINQIWTYPIESPGKVGPHEVFAKLPVREDNKFVGPDGIILSEDGKLYVAHYNMGKVHELNPKGHLIRSFSAGQQRCSNVALGGENGYILYITGAPGKLKEGGILFMIKLK